MSPALQADSLPASYQGITLFQNKLFKCLQEKDEVSWRSWNEEGCLIKGALVQDWGSQDVCDEHQGSEHSGLRVLGVACLAEAWAVHT